MLHVVYLDSGEGDQKHKSHSIPAPVLIWLVKEEIMMCWASAGDIDNS